MVLESIASSLLNKYLGDYVEGNLFYVTNTVVFIPPMFVSQPQLPPSPSSLFPSLPLLPSLYFTLDSFLNAVT